VRRRTYDALAFGGAALAVGASAVIAKALCPGSCVGCGSCVASIAPAAGAALTLGAAIGGPALARALGRDKASRAESRD
jgi:hypothetical protein